MLPNAEPIYIEESMDPGNIINKSRQDIGVMLIILVPSWQLMKNLWFPDHPISIMSIVMMKGQCMNLRFREKKLRRIKNYFK